MSLVSLAQDAERVLGDAAFPAHKEDLINHARAKGAGGDVLGLLQKLPNQNFNSIAEVLAKFPGLGGEPGKQL